MPSKSTHKQQLIYNQQKEIMKQRELERDKNKVHIEFGEMLPEELRDTVDSR